MSGDIVARCVPDNEHICECAFDIGQAEGGNIDYITPSMVDWVLERSDKWDDIAALGEDNYQQVRERTEEALYIALKKSGYHADS